MVDFIVLCFKVSVYFRNRPVYLALNITKRNDIFLVLQLEDERQHSDDVEKFKVVHNSVGGTIAPPCLLASRRSRLKRREVTARKCPFVGETKQTGSRVLKLELVDLRLERFNLVLGNQILDGLNLGGEIRIGRGITHCGIIIELVN